MPTPDTTARSSRQGPLVGVRVLELAGLGPAQHGAMLLADAGAEVIRLDRPAAVPNDGASKRSIELLARGRRSIALDLKRPDGLAAAVELVRWCDVVLDPYRPGVTDRLGLGPEAALGVNPAVIYARMTGWGQSGPLPDRAGHDINYIALTGALELIGDAAAPPPVPLNLVGDFGGGGMLLAFAVSAALVERHRSGRGQVIDVAMIDGVASLLTSIFQVDAGGDWNHARGTNWLQGAAPWYRAYETADGRYITVGALEPQFYALLLDKLGLDANEWPQWDQTLWQALSLRLEALFASRTVHEWSTLFEGSDACFAPALRLDELRSHRHLAARETYVEYDGVTQPAPVPRFSRTPGAIASPPPRAGEHTAEILRELGFGDERLDAMLEAGSAAQLTAAGRA